MFKTVLFPIDHSRESQEAAEVVIDVVKTYKSRLVLLSVVEELNDATTLEPDMVSPEVIATLLQNAQELFANEGIKAEVIERTGKPAFVICDVADEISANLIIMGSRGTGLTDEGAAHSVTNRVINLSPCPVLVVP
jgi:nucleotide-binding universal stress UspA family protein